VTSRQVEAAVYETRCDGCGRRAPAEPGWTVPLGWTSLNARVHGPSSVVREVQGDACTTPCLLVLFARAVWPPAETIPESRTGPQT
jgi:hypothetical protein